MATTDIGRVTPIWRGFYSAATTYELNDIVIDTAGSVWWHKSEELTTGVIPEAGEIWDAVLDMSQFSGLIQAVITTAQTALAAAQEAVADVTADTERAETAAENAEASALSASESAASVGAYAQAAEQAKNAAQTAASQAAASASSAGTSAASAGSSAQAAEMSKTAAQTAATQAAASAETASGAAAVVEQKKAEALAAIEAKGEEVLESIPEDYTALSGDVGELKTQLTTESYDPITTDIPLTFKAGYIATNGTQYSSERYSYSNHIPASKGIIFNFYSSEQSEIKIRYVTVYKNGKVVASLGMENVIDVFTAAGGYDEFVISVLNTYGTVTATQTTYETVLKPVLEDRVITLEEEQNEQKAYFDIILGKQKFVHYTGTDAEHEFNYVSTKRGNRIMFRCNFSTLDAIDVGYKDVNDERKMYLTLDSSTLSIQLPGEAMVSAQHGLTIVNELTVSITNDISKIYVEIASGSEKYEYEHDFTASFYGKAFYNIKNTVSDFVDFSFTNEDIDNDIWMFGDSYFSYGASRWVYYLVNNGFSENCLIDAYAGEPSARSIISLNTLLSLSTPKYIVWALGMNDGSDGSSVSTQWKTAIKSLENICNSKGICLILCTIPTVPSINNELKNDYVRNSGHIYIDFAKAVGAQPDGTWFDGMMSPTDANQTHPSEKGAKTLYQQAITDFPIFTFKH